MRTYVLLAVLTVAVYVVGAPGGTPPGGALAAGFVYDDIHLIVDNERLDDPSGALAGFTGDYYASSVLDAWGRERRLGYYRPIAVLSTWLDHRIWGARAFGYHLTSLILHVAVVLLFFRLASSLTEHRAIAAAGAGLFAVHPAHVESVTFISGRVDVLAALFSLGSLLLLVRAWRAGRLLSVPALAAFVTALLSKEMAATLPAAVFLLAYLFGPSPRRVRDAALRTLPFAIVGVVWWVVRAGILGTATTLAGADRTANEAMLTIGSVLGTYLRLLLLPPFGFNVEPAIDTTAGSAFLGALAYAVALALGVWLLVRARASLAAFGVLWALAALVPVSHVFPVETLIGERYLYIPSLGASLGVAFVIGAITARFSRKRGTAFPGAAFWALAGVIVALYGASTVHRNGFFSDNRSFWQAKAFLTPSAESFTALGNEHNRAGDPRGASDAYVAALRMDGAHLEALNNQALLLLRAGRIDDALSLASHAITINPQYADGLNTIATVFHAKGLFGQAVGQYKRAIRVRPDFRLALVNLGNTYFTVGAHDSAAAAYERALAIEPDEQLAVQTARCHALVSGSSPAGMAFLEREGFVVPGSAKAYLIQANLDFVTGYKEAGVASALRATQTDPTFVEAWIELGHMFAAMNRVPQARAAFERALAVRPGLSVAHNNLGALAENTGDLDEALRRYRRAAELAPKDPVVLRNIGGILLAKGRPDEAIEVLTRSIGLGRDALAFYRRARAYQEIGDFTPAIADYRATLALDPTYPDAHLYLAELLAIGRELDEALSSYESFLRWAVKDDERKEPVRETMRTIKENRARLGS